MHSSAPFQSQSSATGLSLVEIDSATASNHVVGVSAAWRKLLMQAEMVAPHLHVAAIEGEHGAGKHTIARYLFSCSPLAAGAFQRRDACEWLATGPNPSTLTGFIYLDRVDLLAPAGQSQLLSILKNLQDRPAGRAVLLASSQTPLRQMADQGLLLPDLAFRLTAIRFAIPPLRERREDIAPLVQFLLERTCAHYRQRPVVLGPGTLVRLLQHAWPGNVLELSSVLESAIIGANNSVIHASDLALPDRLQPSPGPQFNSQFAANSAANAPVNPAFNRRANSAPGSALVRASQTAARVADLSLDATIHQHVRFVLDLNHGNKLRAARQLAISRSTLYRILASENFLVR
jgi:DNA-binding NtrC family response regulator